MEVQRCRFANLDVSGPFMDQVGVIEVRCGLSGGPVHSGPEWNQNVPSQFSSHDK